MNSLNLKKILLLTIIVAASFTQAKILILTHVYNRSDFIEIQYKTFKKFLQNEYEFIVFSDAPNAHHAQKIKEMCNKYDIEHVQIPQQIHNQPYLQRWPGESYHAPAVRNVNAVMYSLNTRGFEHDDILIMCDSDLFLVKPLDVQSLMQQYDIVAKQIVYNKYPYIWHGLTILNIKTLPDIKTLDFNCGKIDNHPFDAGGHSCFYLRAHPDIRTLYVDELYSLRMWCEECNKKNRWCCTHTTEKMKNAKLDDNQIRYFQNAHNSQFFFDNHFLHYRSGTNWEGRNNQYIKYKMNNFLTYINEILK